MMTEIRYCKQSDIDKVKWDNCIQQAWNGMIYAESCYLDIMASGWDALIMGDYDIVMPLTWRKKMGVSYLYQPAFTQQTGVFSTKPLSTEIIFAFINFCATHFRFAEIFLNYGNTAIHHTESTYATKLANNFILNLNLPYCQQAVNYTNYLKQRIRKSATYGFILLSDVDATTAIAIFKNLYKARLAHIKESDWTNIQTLASHYQKEGRMVIRALQNPLNKEIVACTMLFKDQRRLYNLMSSVSPSGRKQLANYFLYDRIIEEFSNSGLILDFEGSDIPGVAFFYEKFSSENQPYLFLSYNKLPALLRLIKSKK